MKCKHRRTFGYCVAALVLIPSCSHLEVLPPCEDAQPIRVDFIGGKGLNSDDQGAPLPTVIRLMQLKDAAILDSVTPEDVQQHEQEVLGPHMVEVQEVVLDPGGSVSANLKRHADAKQVVAVALFRRPEGLSWRAISTLPPVDVNHCHKKNSTIRIRIHLDTNRVTLLR